MCIIVAMSSLNLHTLDPAELMPLPDVPAQYGPRNEEEQRIYHLVKESFTASGKTYQSAGDLIAELRASLTHKRA